MRSSPVSGRLRGGAQNGAVPSAPRRRESRTLSDPGGARARDRPGRDPRLVAAVPGAARRGGQDRDVLRARRPARYPPLPQCAPGVARARRTARGPVGERHPHGRDRARAHPDHRRPGAREPPGPGPARTGVQLCREVRRHQRHRHRPGDGRSGSRLRPRALRRAPRGSGLRRCSDPPPDLGPARRRCRLHLLAPRRRGAAAHSGQDHRRADQAVAPGGCGIERTRPVQGVSAHLRTSGRHRLRPEQRRGDVERLRPHGARSSRPGGAPRAGQRDPDERAPQLAS